MSFSWKEGLRVDGGSTCPTSITKIVRVAGKRFNSSGASLFISSPVVAGLTGVELETFSHNKSFFKNLLRCTRGKSENVVGSFLDEVALGRLDDFCSVF
ncbi:unnamed protein product [Somion occarium]|uniref:Uncharacterized protein n=1 Tax=Somion occarium TaxID=3059160 RepID=A0ABP1E4R8_9APHY